MTLVLLTGIVAGSAVAAADELDDRRATAEREAAAKKAEREQLEKDLEGTNRKLRAAVLKLNEVEAKIPAAKAALSAAQAASAAARQEAELMAVRAARTQSQFEEVAASRVEAASLTEEARRDLVALARQAKRTNPATTLTLITKASTATDFTAAAAAEAAVARAQSRNLTTLQTSDAALRNQEARLKAISSELEDLRDATEEAAERAEQAEQAAAAKQAEVTALHEQQTQLTADIEAQREAELQEIADAIADQEAIANTIRQLAAQQAERDRIIAERRRQEEAERVAREKAAHDACLAQSGADACAHLKPKPPAPASSGQGFSGFLAWPTSNHTVTSSYGWRLHPTLKINRLHAGVDLRAACGAPIYAAQSGIVVARNWYGTGGNMVLIDHGNNDQGKNVMSRYLHLSAYNVTLNQWVAKGQVIGYSGMTGGVSTGCHLHFEVYINGATQDPLKHLP